MQKTVAFLLLFAVKAQCQVVDVNADHLVGAEEAIAVAEHWKGPAKAPSDHDHLGQTWIGDRNPLKIRGNFARNIIIGPSSSSLGGFSLSPSAPLILDNTATPTNGYHHPDLLLQGTIGMISAKEHAGSELHLVSNSNVFAWLDSDDNSLITTFSVLNGERFLIFAIHENGDAGILGNLTTAGGTLKIDHPDDPANKFLVHASVESPERKNVYDGVATLDGDGEAIVELPSFFESLNTDFRYQLTPVGSPAPNLHLAEKVNGNHFTIAGGNPGQEICWQVTGVRKDAFAKAHPIEVEQEKAAAQRGKYLHPEIFGELAGKGIGVPAEAGITGSATE